MNIFALFSIGQDWKALVNGQDSNKKTFHFAAVDISGESIVTVEETAITKLKFDILKGSIIQGGISSYGISAPFQLKATVKGKNEDLFINGEKMLYANTSKDSSDILNIVVHKQGTVHSSALIFIKITFSLLLF